MAAATAPTADSATPTLIPIVSGSAGTSADNATSADYIRIRSKTVLVSPTQEQFDLLRKRLQGRIDDSRGETIFELGIGEGM